MIMNKWIFEYLSNGVEHYSLHWRPRELDFSLTRVCLIELGYILSDLDPQGLMDISI